MSNIMPIYTSITVLGAGSWGTALAVHLARNGQSTRLWGHKAEHINTLKENRCNTQYLPDTPFPQKLTLHHSLEEAVFGSSEILIAVPSHAFVSVLKQLAPLWDKKQQIISATKGLVGSDKNMLRLPHEEISAHMGYYVPTGILSGPSFAREVAAGLPTALVCATKYPEVINRMTQRLHNKTLRLYAQEDLIGTEICGVVKNILAVAAGIVDGLELGANARSALITRGLAEMIRFGILHGGEPCTFSGLAGIGDIVLSCTSDLSRNRRLGLALSRNQSPENISAEIGQVIESLHNIDSVYNFSQKAGIYMPITEQIYRILRHNLSAADAVRTLLDRPPVNDGWRNDYS